MAGVKTIKEILQNPKKYGFSPINVKVVTRLKGGEPFI